MAGTPFAVAQDVADRWRPLSATEEATADILAADASQMIRDRWPDVDDRIAAGTLDPATLIRVVAGMVKRAMISRDSEGLDSRAQTAGPFSVNDKFSNPMGNLYFSGDDLRVFDGYTSQARVGWLA